MEEIPEFKDEQIICKDCGEEFLFTAGEARFYWEKGLTYPPHRCKTCRMLKRRTITLMQKGVSNGS